MKRAVWALLIGLCCSVLLTGCSNSQPNDSGARTDFASNPVAETPTAEDGDASALSIDRLAGLWIESDEEGNFPEGDSDTVDFRSDGTGTLWITVGDGGTDAVHFSYSIQSGGVITLTQTGENTENTLPNEWTRIKAAIEHTQSNTSLTIVLSDGSTVKYYWIKADEGNEAQ